MLQCHRRFFVPKAPIIAFLTPIPSLSSYFGHVEGMTSKQHLPIARTSAKEKCFLFQKTRSVFRRTETTLPETRGAFYLQQKTRRAFSEMS
mmetsp:Transcript_28930/g.42016  ORF Transcript_28930/g.42016 Transcript_28930/m.42016 type:complete len:91 (+) Transcript_28930:167-439(+)